MSTDMQMKKISMGGALAAMALLACTAAWAQSPPYGGPPGGAPGGQAGPGGPGAPGGPPGGGPPGGGGPMMMGGSLPPGSPEPSPDPRNFDGGWRHDSELVFQNTKDMFGHKLPYTDAGRKVINRRVMSFKNGTPFINASSKCMPMGQPWQMDLNMPWRIFQSKDRFDILFEEYHGYIQILMDQSKAPSGAAAYMGTSVGHWEGNTLVVETQGFKDDMWLDVDGTPASKNAKLTQRIRKVKAGDRWYLEDIFTLDDPTYYTRPWSWVRDYAWHPDLTFFAEYNCELQTGAKGGLTPNLVPEPKD